jgi:hypothetical protein
MAKITDIDRRAAVAYTNTVDGVVGKWRVSQERCEALMRQLSAVNALMGDEA